MIEKFELLIHFIVTLIKLSKPGGIKVVIAETQLMKQQLIVMKRGLNRAPKFTPFDRIFFGLMTFFIGKNRLQKIAVIVKAATILKFHQALVKRQYRHLYSNKAKKTPGRKPQDQKRIDLVIEMKIRNSRIGYGRIAMQIYQAFGVQISRYAVGRILRKNRHKLPPGDGPSWLTFIGHMKDSLWCVDLFRCEAIRLKSHWVMLIFDQFSRRIIGFVVQAGDCDGVANCRLFNGIVAGNCLPKYLSSDNDPLFRFHRWRANLRILEIEELKSIPYVPTSHPFIERIILTCRQEFLDHQLFWNTTDLQRKLEYLQKYYNETRAHSSLEMKTPKEMASAEKQDKKVVSLDHCRWKSHCNGLYKLPVAA